MKRLAIILCAIITVLTSFAQKADKPVLMVLPSYNWCITNGYFKIINENGEEKKKPDWERAFTENAEINNVITTISQMFIDRGFYITSAWDEMKALQEEMAEEMALEADGEGDATMTSLYDQIVMQVKPDILLEINWQTNKLGLNKHVFVDIKSIDSYTNNFIALLQRQSDNMPSSTLLTIMLKQAVEGGFEQLSNDLMTYFENLATNGREIKMNVRVSQNSEINLWSTIKGKQLKAIIQEWVRSNSINNEVNMLRDTKYRVNFRGIRIPLQDKDGVKINAFEWATKSGLEKFLKSHNAPARIESKGLGEIIVRIGAK